MYHDVIQGVKGRRSPFGSIVTLAFVLHSMQSLHSTFSKGLQEQTLRHMWRCGPPGMGDMHSTTK